MVDKKLFKTKLCILYQRGHCNRQSCSFAHGESELRRVFGSYDGRRDHRGGDLRDRLPRRYSPRRYSPGRDARGRHLIRGYSPSRSIEESPDRKRRRRQQLDGQSNNISGDVGISEEPSDHVDGGKPVSESGHALLEQIRGLRADVELLETRRSELEIYLEGQVREADSLTSKIHELEDQLYLEKKECRRVNSKIKKFVRAHSRHSELQEELKRSQRQLAILGEQLGQEVMGAGTNEDLSINILSDEEPLGNNRSSAQNGRQEHSLKWAGAEELRPQVKLNYHHERAYLPDKDYEAVDRQRFGTGKYGDARHKKEKGLLSGVTAGDKSKVSGVGFIPPTGMAAHASDELADVEENVEAAASLPSGTAEDAQDVQNSENVDIV
ncbi:hypothetical protein MLD38_025808 [Melastoma candidum]|uniref:Uncharacterized protein n=1 Tax=Melastoma candidum TaxID=119954 RepID=A0ACB9P024_9MYRT|nr:hypothetical protein MLD38_025808 [Melastoma candidum]